MNYTRRLGGIALLATAVFLKCTSEDRPQTLGDTGLHEPPPGSGAGTGGRRADGSDAGPATGGGGSTGQTATNCGDLVCRGAGQCLLNGGVASCVCDEGYALLNDECVVDETCINLRLLEPGCRQRQGREPALAMVFNVETCAGTTVRPEVLGEVNQAFKVLEDDNDLGNESYAAVYRRNVESDVAIAIDLSTSVASNSGLALSLFQSLDVLIDDLTPSDGESRVNVELIVFGRSVDVALPFTNDMQAVKQRLDELEANLDSAVIDPVGTNLNGVINKGQDTLKAAWRQRFTSSDGSVLSTGTLITITDGVDTSGETLDPIDPRFNLISVGVSNDIDDAELTRIGPHGSFLAPTDQDRTATFEKVAQRVAEYPSRAHLLAYCSPAVAGRHTVVATLANREAAASASCNFDATEFGVGAGVCTAEFVDEYCSSGEHGCGTFLACGSCQADAGVNAEDRWFLPEDRGD